MSDDAIRIVRRFDGRLLEIRNGVEQTDALPSTESSIVLLTLRWLPELILLRTSLCIMADWQLAVKVCRLA